MSHKSYTRIWIHLLFSTKNTQPLIPLAAYQLIQTHLRAQLSECGCSTVSTAIAADHVHLLFRQNEQRSVTEIAKIAKGNTSHWINKNEITPDRFAWQEGFYAFSLDDQSAAILKSQLLYHSEHHSNKNFLQEVDEIISCNGLLMNITPVSE